MLRGALRWATDAVEADPFLSADKHAERGATRHSTPAQPKKSVTAPAEYPIPAPVAPQGPINIDVGRQLLVDDYLIEQNTLTRTFHQAKLYQDAPCSRPKPGSKSNAVRPREPCCSMAACGTTRRIALQDVVRGRIP